MAPYENRRQAGRLLASGLTHYAGRSDVVVLALPRGGVPVAYEVALYLDAPLDVFVVRKLGVPGYEEVAMGAIASGGVAVFNAEIASEIDISREALEHVIALERRELERRERAYRSECPPLDVQRKTIILVDDGLATGSSMRAAVMSLKQREPAKLVVAVPIASPSTCQELAGEVDDVVCAATPEPFRAVGEWYADFSQTTDEEVRALLEASRVQWLERRPSGSRSGGRALAPRLHRGYADDEEGRGKREPERPR